MHCTYEGSALGRLGVAMGGVGSGSDSSWIYASFASGGTAAGSVFAVGAPRFVCVVGGTAITSTRRRLERVEEMDDDELLDSLTPAAILKRGKEKDVDSDGG